MNVLGRTRKAALVVGATAALLLVAAAPVSAAPLSPIDQRYASDHALAAMLGPPVSPEYSIADGRERDYKWGSLLYKSYTGVHEVHGAIRWKYRSIGGPSKLGFPIRDEVQVVNNFHGENVTIGAQSTFEDGEIFYNAGSGATNWMGADVAGIWQDQSFPYYGVPLADEQPFHGGTKTSFSTATIYGSAHGTYAVVRGDAIVESSDLETEYDATGGVTGYLGWPTGDRKLVATPLHQYTYVQTFVGGAIYRIIPNSGSAAAHAVHGAIYWAYTHTDQTKLGYPVSEELAAPGGRLQHFELGSIFWNATTHKVTITYGS